MLLFDHATHSYFLSWAEVRACLLFYRNFIGVAGGGAAGHFWSLSLEEQFYLVWPAILLFAGIRRCRWIAAVGATACATYRYAFWARYNHNLTDYQTQVRADALLLGCLLALLLTDARVRQFATRWSPYSALPALALLLYCIASFQWLAPLMESIAIAMLMTASLFHPEALWSRLLALPPLAWLGRISYSVYVWQAFFMLPWSATIRPWLLCIGLPTISLLSYYCIEEPSANLGRRLTLRKMATETPQRTVPWNQSVA
jgi:peptidoglycan/LPS O-acetylase OafA/YrhL